MKNPLLIFVITSLLISCSKENTDDGLPKVLMMPAPAATIEDQQIHLEWMQYTFYQGKSAKSDYMVIPYEIVYPDIIEIYQSESMSGKFDLIYKAHYKDADYLDIKHLENDKRYFYYVIAKKIGFPDNISDTIVAVPNARFASDEWLSFDYNHTVIGASINERINKIAYVDWYYNWQGGENCCTATSILICNPDGSNNELIDVNAYDPDWSPDKNILVYKKEIGNIYINYGIPSVISLYDYEKKSIKYLTEDTMVISSPVFSENGENILFLSNSNTNYAINSIWSYNFSNQKAQKEIDLTGTDLHSISKLNWIDNNRFLFQGADYGNYSICIFTASISDKQIEKLFDSDWNDFAPSISPDHLKIAFISDRSGSSQIWIYDLLKNKYRQITGFDRSETIYPDWCRIEWTSNSEIIFTFNSGQLIKRKID